MHPVHDIDAALLLGTAISSKRRPADLAEIIAATDLIQGFIPYESKLRDAFFRLASHGLISEAEGGYSLTPIAQQMVAGVSPKAEMPDRVAAVIEKLLAFEAKGEHPPIVMAPAQYEAAVTAHRASKAGAGRNVLMPKPKLDRHFKVDGKWRRAPGTRQRKT